MSDPQVQPLSEIKLDESNLYREEVFTDLRVGSLKQLTPVTKSGERDLARPMLYVGETQLMSQVGPLPVQTRIEAENLDDFKGLNQHNSWYALIMAMVMFSMAGVPPTIGFFAKLAVIQAVVDVGMTWLAVVAVLMAVVGAFYYLRVIKLVYFDPPADEATAIQAPVDVRFLMSRNGLAMLFLLPAIGPIQELCGRAISSVLGAF